MQRRQPLLHPPAEAVDDEDFDFAAEMNRQFDAALDAAHVRARFDPACDWSDDLQADTDDDNVVPGVFHAGDMMDADHHSDISTGTQRTAASNSNESAASQPDASPSSQSPLAPPPRRQLVVHNDTDESSAASTASTHHPDAGEPHVAMTTTAERQGEELPGVTASGTTTSRTTRRGVRSRPSQQRYDDVDEADDDSPVEFRLPSNVEGSHMFGRTTRPLRRPPAPRLD